jgi:hypothetical protein
VLKDLKKKPNFLFSPREKIQQRWTCIFDVNCVVGGI